MAEKIVSKLDDVAINDKDSNDYDDENVVEVFLKELHNKVRQFEEVSNVEYKVDRRLIYFSLETKKLKCEQLATKIIDLIDDQVFFFFFQKSKNLSKLNWCAKYMLYSDFINSRKVQLIQFYWFQNFFRHKICPCFICDSYRKRKLKNDNYHSAPCGIWLFFWNLIYRSFENGDLSETNFLHLKMKLINSLYSEYKKFNYSIEEFYYCVGGIELNDSLLNPLEFELNQFAYKVHVENCYKLS